MQDGYGETTTSGDTSLLKALNDRILQAEEDGDAETLGLVLTEDFTIIRTKGQKQGRETYLQAVGPNAHRGRTADSPEIRLYHDCAVVLLRVTTSEQRDGTLVFSHYWNTRVFLRNQEQEWGCTTWQVTEISGETGK